MYIISSVDIEKRLECVRNREELEKLDQHIIKRQRRIRVNKPPVPSPRKTPASDPPSSASHTYHDPNSPQLPSKINFLDELSSSSLDEDFADGGTGAIGIGAKSKKKHVIHLPPPPPPCPGPDPFKNPFVIYENPIIHRIFKPDPSGKRESFNLNKIAEDLTDNLNNTEIFSNIRTSIFNKYNEYHRRSTLRSGTEPPVLR